MVQNTLQICKKNTPPPPPPPLHFPPPSPIKKASWKKKSNPDCCWACAFTQAARGTRGKFLHGPLVFGVFWPQNTGVLTIIRPGIPEFLPEFLSGFLKEQEYRILRWRCKCTGQPHGILEKAVGIRVIRPEHRDSHQNSYRNSRILTGIPIGILKRTRIKNS